MIFFVLITQSFCFSMDKSYKTEDLFKIKESDWEPEHYSKINKAITTICQDNQAQELLLSIQKLMQEAGKQAYIELVLKEEAAKWAGTRGTKTERIQLLTMSGSNEEKEKIATLLDQKRKKIEGLNLDLQIRFYEQILNSLNVLLVQNISSRYIQFVVEEHLEKLQIPQSVIETIETCQDMGKINIIKSEQKTCFAEFSKTKNFSIRINPKDIDAQPTISVLNVDEDKNYILKKQSADLSTILAHELLHIWHFIESKEQFMKDSRQSTSNYWKIFKWQDLKEFSRLWQDAEEQRTVIGIQDNKDICELIIRCAAKLPIRYPYLVVDDLFVEKDIIDVILKNYGIESVKSITTSF